MRVAQLSILDTLLVGNRAHRHGGTVYVATRQEDRSVNSTLRMERTWVQDSVAEATGGACHA